MNIEEFLPKKRSLWTYFVLEPLYKPVIEFFLNIGWHPNIISLFSIAFTVASVANFAFGRDYPSLFLGSLFFELAYFFDCVDGPVARATGRLTKLGLGLEVTGDSLRNYGALIGLTYRYVSLGKEWLILFALTFITFYNGAMWVGYKRLVEGREQHSQSEAVRHSGLLGKIETAFFREDVSFWPLPILVELETLVFFILPLLNLGDWGIIVGAILSPVFLIGALI